MLRRAACFVKGVRPKGVLFTFAVQKATPPRKRVRSTAKRHVAHRASPRHCRHARARCYAPCTRPRACRARSTRTLHSCEPRQRRTCSHIATLDATRQNALAVLVSLAIGWLSACPALALPARAQALQSLCIVHCARVSLIVRKRCASCNTPHCHRAQTR